MTSAAPQVLLTHSEAAACFDQQRCEAFACTATAWSHLHRATAPQASGPRWLDCEFEADAASALIAVPSELPCFAGHFPGRPLLPGVLQLVWARALLHCWQPDAAVGTIRQLKFRQPVEPPAVLRVVLHRSAGKIAARVEHPAGTVADWVFVTEPLAPAGTA
ncbi:MAG: hypothetical protein AAGG11_08235 [Pseudomonadota bacterium]